MKHVVPAAILAALSAFGTASAEEALNFEDETTRINYSLGYQIGGDFKRQELELNGSAVLQGIEDALGDGEPKMTEADMRKTLMDLKRKVIADQKRRKQEQAEERAAASKRFLEENATKEGVITTESGLQYKILEEGSGKTPGPTDMVTVHYRGTLADGKEFDSSHKRGKPATFQLNRVVKGWTEGLQLLKEGGKAQLVIPPDLAYGDRGPLANQTLIFDVELISVGGEAPAHSHAEEPAKPEGESEKQE